MADKIIRGMDKEGKIRFFAADTRNLVNTATQIHLTTPVVSAAFGRTLTANCMMSIMLKGEKETLSLQLKGNGPVATIVTVCNSSGDVRGYVGNNCVDLPLNSSGKLDVGCCIGEGYLTVIKDLGLKEPYIGRVELITGEVADDLTYYFASSEQIPSVVALGVLVDTDLTIKASGGYIVQLMPDATEDDIDKLENNIAEIKSVTTMLDNGKTIEEIVSIVMRGFDYTITETTTPHYKCNCSKEKIEKSLISIGKEELNDMIIKDKGAEVVCYFCNTKYKFNENDLLDISSNC